MIACVDRIGVSEIVIISAFAKFDSHLAGFDLRKFFNFIKKFLSTRYPEYFFKLVQGFVSYFPENPGAIFFVIAAHAVVHLVAVFENPLPDRTLFGVHFRNNPVGINAVTVF